ncbi:MAG: hypothetical protein Q9162_005963 [Coniocarpon cinnabarinum]
MQLASSFTGHFLLTRELLPELLAAHGTVVNVTSQAYELSEVRFDDPNFSGGKTYNPWYAYGQAKTANILHAYALSGRYKSQGLAALAVHPGHVTGTHLVMNSGVTKDAFAEGYRLAVARHEKFTGENHIDMGPQKTVQQGVMDMLRAALDPEVRKKAPALLWDAGYNTPYNYATGSTECEKLWTLGEKLTGAH